MKQVALNLSLLLATLSLPASYAMSYRGPTGPQLILPMVPDLVQNFSTCSSTRHTIAVGYETFVGGFRLLCADARDIGFWTTPVKAELVGDSSHALFHFLCPSGTALADVYYVEGINFPFAVCAELLPGFASGTVLRGALITPTNSPVTLQFPICGPTQFIQTLRAVRDNSGSVKSFSTICNNILTTELIHGKNLAAVDLAVRTVGQTASLGQLGSQTFEMDVFNLGFAPVHAANVTLEIRYDTFAWEFIPEAGMVCSDIVVHKGPIDMISLGKRCTLPGLGLKALGGETSLNLTIQPSGGPALRPLTTQSQPIISIKAIVKDESVDGADGDPTNDQAAFPVNIV